jgi:hypothetical protein
MSCTLKCLIRNEICINTIFFACSYKLLSVSICELFVQVDMYLYGKYGHFRFNIKSTAK